MDFLIDCDEVLTDFVPRFIPIIAGLLGREWELDELPDDEWDVFSILNETQYDAVCAIMERPGFCASFHPSDEAKEAVRELRDYCDVYAVTAPNYMPFWVNERYYWLNKHFGFNKYNIINTHAKFQVHGDFLLDDNPKHVRGWIAKNPQGVGMVWNTPNNKRLVGYDDLRVGSWDEVIDRVKKSV